MSFFQFFYKKSNSSPTCRSRRLLAIFLLNSSLDDLLLEYQEKTSSEYIEQISKYRIPEDFDKITREFFLFSEKYGEAYEKITSNKKYLYTRQRMINNVMSAT